MLCSALLFLNLGGGEVFIIVLVIIMFFGSDKLPGLAKGISRGLREINDAKDQIQNEIQKSTSGLREELTKHTNDLQNEINKANSDIQSHANDISKTISEQEVKSETETPELVKETPSEIPQEETPKVENTIKRKPNIVAQPITEQGSASPPANPNPTLF